MSTWQFTSAPTWGGRPVARCIAHAEQRGRIVVTGTVQKRALVDTGTSASTLLTLSDGTGAIGLLFVGRRSVPGLGVGTRVTVEGTARPGTGGLEVWNPLYRIEADDEHRRPLPG